MPFGAALARDSSPSGIGRSPVRVSIVVPIHNEADNLEALAAAVEVVLADRLDSLELILVDDGSTDGSPATVLRLASSRPWIRALLLARNYGQSTALQAGFDHATGDLVVTLDADLQNDPKDIPRLLGMMESDPELDVISGWRRRRHDAAISRILPSRIANAIISTVTGVRLHDYGCAMKVYRRPVLKGLRLYGEQHRFIPVLAAASGARIQETVVDHHPRIAGKSKYGIDRTARVLLDLVWVTFLLRFMDRPMHAFGGAGLVVGGTGIGILCWLTLQKILFGEAIGGRPLLLMGVMLAIVGVQLVAAGVLGEMLTRIYHEPAGRPQYRLREIR